MMEDQKPEAFDVDSHERALTNDATARLAEPSDFDFRHILHAAQRYNPENDVRDMMRLGKTQELKRRFRFFTIGGYIMLLGLTWEFALTTRIFGLSNGGTAGAIWLNLIVCCFMFTVVLSMAEMASLAPTSGGQYHWVSELAPPEHQKALSYIIGWLSALGWQTALPQVRNGVDEKVLKKRENIGKRATWFENSLYFKPDHKDIYSGVKAST